MVLLAQSSNDWVHTNGKPDFIIYVFWYLLTYFSLAIFVNINKPLDFFI
jgi:uncharacterized membrane protein (DUF106 family)